MRLQREDVLNEIVVKAINNLDQPGSAVRPIPNKFLVPFLEKASVEEPGSELIDKWVSLLTAAATEFNPHMIRFSSILAEMGPEEVNFLRRLCREARVDRPIYFINDVPHTFFQVHLVQAITDDLNPKISHERNVKHIIQQFELPGGIFLFLCVHRWRGEGFDETHPLFSHESRSSIGLLQSLGILERLTFLSGKKGNLGWYGDAVALTDFGVDFVSACDPEIREAVQKHKRELNAQARVRSAGMLRPPYSCGVVDYDPHAREQC